MTSSFANGDEVGVTETKVTTGGKESLIARAVVTKGEVGFGSARMGPAPLHSSLPQDLIGFERYCRYWHAGDYAGRIIIRGTVGRNARRIDVTMRRPHERLASIHTLAKRPVLSFGVQLDAHGVRIEFIQVDLNREGKLIVFFLNRK